MKYIFILLTFFINLIYISGQTVHESIENINTLVKKLPKTISSGKGELKFQSEYSFEYNESQNTILITDTRYYPNSDKKHSDIHYNSIPIESLHKDGFVYRSLKDTTEISFQIFTSSNQNTIESTTYKSEKFMFGLMVDRVTLGSWKKDDAKKIIRDITAKFKELCDKLNQNINNKAPDINKKGDFDFMDKPNTKIYSVKHKKIENDPAFLNASIDNPALFGNAKTSKENSAEIKKYLKGKIKFNGSFSASIVISKTGEIREYKSFGMSSKKVEKKMKALIQEMPRWKPGEHKGKKVSVTYTIYISN